jgi:hypothetical protein
MLVMKKWPQDERECVPTVNLLKPIKEAMKKLYNFTRTPEKEVKYEGYEFGPIGGAANLAPDLILNKENLNYNEFEQGIDALDVILTITFNLGIEQGRRYTVQENCNTLSKYICQIKPATKVDKELLIRANELLFGSQLKFDWTYDPNEKEPEKDQKGLSPETTKAIKSIFDRFKFDKFKL